MSNGPWSVSPGAVLGGGAVLIGGRSRRMGRPKQLVELDGETWVERVARALDEVVDEVVLVGAGELPERLHGRVRIDDPVGAAGPAGGILAALEHRPGTAWVVVACDQPRIRAAALSWLLGERRTGVQAVQPRISADRVEPFPGVYEPGARDALALLARSPGAGSSLQRLRELIPVATPRVPSTLVESFRGANTPEEAAGLRTAMPGGEEGGER